VAACTPGFIPQTADEAMVEAISVAPRFFTTIRTPLIAGREFDWRDRPGAAAPLVAIVNEAFAARFLVGRNPLEQRFGLNCPTNSTAYRVVGVVGDAKNNPRQVNRPRAYFPLGNTSEALTLVMRTAGPPERLIPTVRRTMADFNAAIPTFGEVTPVELREQQMRQERLLTNMIVTFSTVALLLSALGIYGMLGYLVVRRTRDLCIRIAIGARPVDVAIHVLVEAVLPVGVGLSIGAFVSIIAARWTQSLLFGVSAHDLTAMAAAIAALLVIASVAAAIPARRAARIDPLRALRFE